MRKLKYLLQKEFIQIFRNKAMLPIIFVLPIIQLILLTLAADFEIKNISYAFVDNDQSQESKRLLARFDVSPYFDFNSRQYDFEQGMALLDKNEALLIIRIPQNFSDDLQKNKHAAIMLDINSIDGQAAGLSYGYAQGIIQQFNSDIVVEWNGLPTKMQFPIKIKTKNWYNLEMVYSNLMVPGILALLITMVGMFLSSMNIVREKEIGTIEQINVTPISKSVFLLGKLIPFWVIGLFELAFGLIVGKLLFDLPIEGSLPLLFAYSAIYLVVVLGLGLWISTFTDTQQQAMFLSWFLIVIFILMSGLFTPIENMPKWAQNLTYLNPAAYIIKVMRAILLKGSNFQDLKMDFLIISLYAVGMLSLAITSYKKRN
jgi:ABC-2 type transport system permease protein